MSPLFKYGISEEYDVLSMDCNESNDMKIFIERRLIEFPTDYDMINGCSKLFIKWYNRMCKDCIPDFNKLGLASEQQKDVMIQVQMSQLAACIAADYINVNGLKINNIFFCIEILLMVALRTRMMNEKDLNMTSMFECVACRSVDFVKPLCDVRPMVDRMPIWVEVQLIDGQNRVLIHSSKLDELFTMYIDEDVH